MTDDVTITDGAHTPLAFQEVTNDGDMLIGDSVSIGIGAIFLGGVTIGSGAQVRAGAVVVKMLLQANACRSASATSP
jgi:acetyltransferase-like isoleucine patch superfamily enzyme